ncbi:hypothetical protein ABW21_db0203939 [Orbilia brochopaga]|nr:hypothetical protein ABW21_db0203939 [Drechslerella brochopaga]
MSGGQLQLWCQRPPQYGADDEYDQGPDAPGGVMYLEDAPGEFQSNGPPGASAHAPAPFTGQQFGGPNGPAPEYSEFAVVPAARPPVRAFGPGSGPASGPPGPTFGLSSGPPGPTFGPSSGPIVPFQGPPPGPFQGPGSGPPGPIFGPKSGPVVPFQGPSSGPPGPGLGPGSGPPGPFRGPGSGLPGPVFGPTSGPNGPGFGPASGPPVPIINALDIDVPLPRFPPRARIMYGGDAADDSEDGNEDETEDDWQEWEDQPQGPATLGHVNPALALQHNPWNNSQAAISNNFMPHGDEEAGPSNPIPGLQTYPPQLLQALPSGIQLDALPPHLAPAPPILLAGAAGGAGGPPNPPGSFNPAAAGAAPGDNSGDADLASADGSKKPKKKMSCLMRHFHRRERAAPIIHAQPRHWTSNFRAYNHRVPADHINLNEMSKRYFFMPPRTRPNRRGNGVVVHPEWKWNRRRNNFCDNLYWFSLISWIAYMGATGHAIGMHTPGLEQHWMVQIAGSWASLGSFVFMQVACYGANMTRAKHWRMFQIMRDVNDIEDHGSRWPTFSIMESHWTILGTVTMFTAALALTMTELMIEHGVLLRTVATLIMETQDVPW